MLNEKVFLELVIGGESFHRNVVADEVNLV